jgi:hypothetical protein
MPNCKDISGLATDYTEGALDPAARRDFEEHLAGCGACRTWVRQLELTAKLAGTLPPPDLTAESKEALLRRFDAWAARTRTATAPVPVEDAAGTGSRLRWEAFFVAVGIVAVLVGLARDPSRAVSDWLVAAALAAVAIALTALARRLTLRFAVAAISAALVAAVIQGGAGPVAFPGGLHCALTEGGGAVVAAGVAWLASRRRRLSTSFAVWAAAGALAGDAALQIACTERASLPHVAVFHVGGLVVIAAAAAALAALRSWRTA